MMKKFAKVMMAIGTVAFLVGASGMDSPSIFAPLMMVFGGIGLIYAGNKIDEEYV